MEITKSYESIEIRVFNDVLYDHKSNNDLVLYDNIYCGKSPDEYINSKHGIKVFKDGALYKSALLINGFGGTGVHDTGFVIDDDKLLMCCADSVFCLTLPDLKLLWRTQADDYTCFEIFKFQGDFIVHGELEISRLNKQGKILWRHGGEDIFTTIEGVNDFTIEENKIIATDWNYRKYVIDPETGHSNSYS